MYHSHKDTGPCSRYDTGIAGLEGCGAEFQGGGGIVDSAMDH